MDDDSNLQRVVKWGFGALGLGALATAVMIPQIGIWIALTICSLALFLFGGYYLWQRRRARRQREQFTSAIEAQTAAVPNIISDPNKRAALDKLRQKFQKGLQEFKSRGKDIYKLPWYVIIGESGSGKSEAIRHSGIDFARGLQDEFQGSGGTVNMDWWFTNRGIILDTAGSMIFNEAQAGEVPEWREFLRLLKKNRPHSPINGLLLVLSIESLIKDSSDKIAQKAGILARQMDLIQQSLDVRFPVYLLITKCDLLTGFREFFDNIDDPLLQHQIFGWSNSDPLDSAFRADLVEQHLKGIAERVRRRRLALLREASLAGRVGDTQRFYSSSVENISGKRLDEVDAMFALSESILRLAPRLRRYLETVFVAGEFSAKPIFLRGVYFTSSMREGKALDEAIAFATGLSLDQLPEDRSWEKNRAFFLRDLFHEKVFRESGLVTRATNTLQLLRQRKLIIFGTITGALLLALVFSFIAFWSLKTTVLKEASYWHAGATNWSQGAWSPSIVSSVDPFHFVYAGTNIVPDADNLTLAEYHEHLERIAEKPLSVSWIFKPMAWINAGAVMDRAKAQRLVFEGGVIRPLILDTRTKMVLSHTNLTSSESLARHREALLALMDLEADARVKANQNLSDPIKAAKYLKRFLSYLTDTEITPDTNLVNTFVNTYSKTGLAKNSGTWPPEYLLGGDILSSNVAINVGIDEFQKAGLHAQSIIEQNLRLTDDFADKLSSYQSKESAWLANTNEPCQLLQKSLVPAKRAVDNSWKALASANNFSERPFTSLNSHYAMLIASAKAASASAIESPFNRSLLQLPEYVQIRGLFSQISGKLKELVGHAADSENNSFNSRQNAIASMDLNCLAPSSTNTSDFAYQTRWQLYEDACSLDTALGFPILFNDSERTMDAAKLRSAHELLGSLAIELQNPGLKNYPVLAALQKNREAYDAVVSALANDDGTPVGWELWFVPPDEDNSADRTMLTIFPYMELSAGGNPIDSDNLTRAIAPIKLGKFSVDQGLKIVFQRHIDNNSFQEIMPVKPDWAAVRLIQDYKAERKDDGKVWRFKVQLEDKSSSRVKAGNFTFEIRLVDSKNALPKIKDWPRLQN